MKNHYTLIFSFAFAIGSFAAFSQHRVGNLASFKQSLDETVAKANLRQGERAPFFVSIDSQNELEIVPHHAQDSSDVYVGRVVGHSNSAFRIKIKGIKTEGFVSLVQSKKAYKFYSDPSGNLFSTPVDINEIVCIEYAEQALEAVEALEAIPPASSVVFKLQSFPSATSTAYLDFDGQLVFGTSWVGGDSINAVAGNFTEAEIQGIFDLVSEDYRGFNINITTDIEVFNKAPKASRMRCIFTPTKTAAPTAGGVAYVGSFTWGGDGTPCWVFNTGVRGAGEAASHEIGHTLNLKHDGRTTPKEDYFSGHANWGPIMGATYSKAIVQWSKGEYNSANNKEDDITIITSRNGFSFRTDDHGNTTTTATTLKMATTGVVTASENTGVISTKNDIDVFSFTTAGGTLSLTINPALSNPDLDVLAILFKSNGDTLGVYNPTGMGVTIAINLSAGTYFVSIDGTGAANPASTGYSDYASAGLFTISGTVPQTKPANILPNVSITSPKSGTIYDGPAIVDIAVNTSDPDGTIKLVEFFNGNAKLGEDATAPYTFSWTNVAIANYNITAKATDNLNGVTTSSSVTITVKKPDCKVADVFADFIDVIGTPGSYNNNGYVKDRAFDGDVTTYVDAASTSGSFVGVVLDGVYKITGVRFYPRTSYNGRMTGGKFQGSTTADFSSGVVDLATIATAPTVGWNCLTFTNQKAFKYVRYVSPANSNGNVAEIEFYGVKITNSAPLISLTSPINNSYYFIPTNITVTATASDPDGTIIKVAFYADTTKLGEDNTAPYTLEWNNPAKKIYGVTAIAYDNYGEFTIADTAKVIVMNPICRFSGAKLTGTTLGSTGSYNNSGNTISKAFDKDTLTYFDAAQQGNSWMGLDLGTAKKIAGVRFFPRIGLSSRMIGGRFQVATNSTFTTGVINLDTITEIKTDEWNCLELKTTANYRYVRYLSPSTGRGNIAELEFYSDNIATELEDEFESLATISVSPNPFNQQLSISAKGEITEARLLNLLGEQVLDFGKVNQADPIKITKYIPSGMYLLIVKSGNTQKVVKVEKTE